MQPSGDRTYYFISDLHIGGDEQLQNVEFEDELLAFLRDLEQTDEDAELVVNGDAFGLWEFTELEGLEKLDALVDRYPRLFEQLRKTGQRIPITFIPGNHDYELACYPEYVDRLAEYNVVLEQEVVITREVGGRRLWIEHGQQRDANNRSPDFGNPHANPPGYFVNRHITSRAGKISGRGKFNWLKDIQSVTPMTQIPDWMISNYFYREMSPFLRYASLPFLLLFNVSVLYLLVVLLDVSGLWPTPQRVVNAVLAQFGIVGALIDAVLFVNLVVIAILVLISIPLFFFVRDTRKTLRRFGLIEGTDPEEMRDVYVEGAREVFAAHAEVACFIYGHTHRPSVTEVDGRVVVNTGTWLKRLTRKSAVFGLLPWVFYPSYCLNYVRIFESEGSVAVEYHRVEKSTPPELTLLERLLTRAPRSGASIPERTLVGPQPNRRSADREETLSTRPSADERSA
ncbi:Calcineurin-like phosphoesterase [Halogranum gelatinilyticum]|uniref:Calcineurin-like phosphoesterase n=1 Tax=Halogranum gelatinilyticum TaxID=660521 RepID=A0A1G9ZLL4_9EURY|nr:metallophosphoesterase [Halogranum gelatinilyticum]SDN22248.1 Calcineurin-like phosphoesterase [Halogranum gelatinilyticum]